MFNGFRLRFSFSYFFHFSWNSISEALKPAQAHAQPHKVPIKIDNMPKNSIIVVTSLIFTTNINN